MVYRKTKQKVRRVYSRSKSILSGDIFKNPIAVGLLTGIAKNAMSGKKIIDIENIKKRISKIDGTNPLILFGAGLVMKNPIITAIGLFGIVDPPNDAEKKEEYIGYSNIGENEESPGYLNIGENEEPAEYSNIGENEGITPKKRCIY